ncbi:hypothetical protein RvY_01118 [Ramazzottius varieornatus]|uniref:Uncharacterized protein n=1 Tax=Ramazzottius varieornatus TaxID=947166 RepID=A0A1D1UIR8_RAMVA|nr:hypothetical protein RvY_01118 [Ramazzottius varieornatus]
MTAKKTSPNRKVTLRTVAGITVRGERRTTMTGWYSAIAQRDSPSYRDGGGAGGSSKFLLGLSSETAKATELCN